MKAAKPGKTLEWEVFDILDKSDEPLDYAQIMNRCGFAVSAKSISQAIVRLRRKGFVEKLVFNRWRVKKDA